MCSNPAGIVSEAVLNTILSDRGSDLPSAPEDPREPPSALRNRNEVAPRLPVGVVGPGTIYTQRLGRAEPAVSLAPLAIITRTATTKSAEIRSPPAAVPDYGPLGFRLIGPCTEEDDGRPLLAKMHQRTLQRHARQSHETLERLIQLQDQEDRPRDREGAHAQRHKHRRVTWREQTENS